MSIKRLLREHDQYVNSAVNGVSVQRFKLYINLFSSSEITDETKSYPKGAISRVIELVEVLRDHPNSLDTDCYVESWPSNCMWIITTVDKTQSAILLCEDHDLVPVRLEPIYL